MKPDFDSYGAAFNKTTDQQRLTIALNLVTIGAQCSGFHTKLMFKVPDTGVTDEMAKILMLYIYGMSNHAAMALEPGWYHVEQHVTEKNGQVQCAGQGMRPAVNAAEKYMADAKAIMAVITEQPKPYDWPMGTEKPNQTHEK